jgi:hypothetical protein
VNAKSRILDLLQGDTGLDDDQIADRLQMNRHYVNSVCRGLALEGLVLRIVGADGKLVNSRTGKLAASIPASFSSNTSHRRPTAKGADRAKLNVKNLVERFSDCVLTFEENAAFPGPSIYFHERALEVRVRHESASSLMADTQFFEYVYAVLPAWGMHRMGKSAAKVGGFVEMVESFRLMTQPIQELWYLSITDIEPADVADVADAIWNVVSSLKVSTSGTRIVAGTKALHHVLPNLVPPIDRQYTFRFFTGQKSVTGGERNAFLNWFPYFCEIGSSCNPDIAFALSRSGFMATGPAKVIDNAIIGFMQMSGDQSLKKYSSHE